MPVGAERFRLGVNYWPSETAMGWLRAYDGAVVRRDLSCMAAAGLDTVRIFVRWEDAQPAPDVLDHATLAALVDTADAAAGAGVELVVTLFTGHMSGVNWVPAWATGGSQGDPRFRVVSGGAVQPGAPALRNWYSDPEIVDAQARLAAGVSGALAGHPAVWAWDLGNENSNCTVPPSRDRAERWLERMTSIIRSTDPGRPVTVGTHMEDLEEDRVIGPAEAARWCDFVCMHGYPAYTGWAAGPSDPLLVPFLAEVTAWLAGGAPVLFEELGQSTAPAGQLPVGMQVSEAEAADYTARTLGALRSTGAIGALLWCFADYSAERYGEPPFDMAVHERTFGLWRSDRTPKPAVAALASGRDNDRSNDCSNDRSNDRSSTCRLPATIGSWVDITPEELAADRRGQLARLYRRYRQQAAAGEHAHG